MSEVFGAEEDLEMEGPGTKKKKKKTPEKVDLEGSSYLYFFPLRVPPPDPRGQRIRACWQICSSLLVFGLRQAYALCLWQFEVSYFRCSCYYSLTSKVIRLPG